MNESTVRILRAGKGTLTGLSFENGKPDDRLIRVGKGQFLDDEFTEISDAKNHACSELLKDPSALFYIVVGDQVLDTVINLEYRNIKNRRSSVIYSVISTFVVLSIAICISLFVMPFTSLLAHSLFTGGMTLLYLALLLQFGTRNIDALIIMAIIFVLTVLIAPTIKKQMQPKPNKVSGATVTTEEGRN